MIHLLLKGLLNLLAVALALLAIAHFVPGIAIESTYTAFVVAVLWGVIALLFKPVLSVLTLPINILTLGLFSLVVNALLFWLLSSFVAGFSVAGFIPAFIGSLILSVVMWVLHKIF
ncbi:MAG TPA: phage holin family protein [Candidatus Paceibacterota bacterium]